MTKAQALKWPLECCWRSEWQSHRWPWLTLTGTCRLLRAGFPGNSDFLGIQISWKLQPCCLLQFQPHFGWIWVFFPKVLTADTKAVWKDFTVRLLQATPAEKKGTNLNKGLCQDAQRYPGNWFPGNEEVKAAQGIKIAGLGLWMALRCSCF